MAKGRYYLGRVAKSGVLNTDKVLHAIKHSTQISVRDYTWTITDIVDETPSFIFGKMSKYSQEGVVRVVDDTAKSQVDSLAPNLLKASSPFVYLPDYSGLAYLHVWNGIQEGVFRRRFEKLIKEVYENFFVDCYVEPITEYATFAAKLAKFSKITDITATVHPPNPLFGRIWADLKNYIKARNAEEMSVQEKSEKEEGLRTQLPPILHQMSTTGGINYEIPLGIADAALLMAADGYGRGRVTGIEDGTYLTISTGENQRSFLSPKEPDPFELANRAVIEFEKINSERNMRHDE